MRSRELWSNTRANTRAKLGVMVDDRLWQRRLWSKDRYPLRNPLVGRPYRLFRAFGRSLLRAPGFGNRLSCQSRLMADFPVIESEMRVE
jgi:hypothetical protein